MNINGMLKHTKLKTHSFAKVELQQRLFEATKICNVAFQVISSCANSFTESVCEHSAANSTVFAARLWCENTSVVTLPVDDKVW